MKVLHNSIEKIIFLIVWIAPATSGDDWKSFWWKIFYYFIFIVVLYKAFCRCCQNKKAFEFVFSENIINLLLSKKNMSIELWIGDAMQSDIENKQSFLLIQIWKVKQLNLMHSYFMHSAHCQWRCSIHSFVFVAIDEQCSSNEVHYIELTALNIHQHWTL